MEQLILIKELHELKKLQEYIEQFDFIAFDTETTGVDKESNIIGFSVCAELDKAYYVVLAYWDPNTKQLISLETKHGAADFLKTLQKKQLIMHNAVFDCWMVENNYKIQLMPSLHTDTMILGHLLDENRSNGLKELALTLFGQTAVEEQRLMKESVTNNGGLMTREHYELYKADCDLLGKYGAKDAILTLKIFYIFVEQLYKQGLEKFFYEEESMPLLRQTTYQLNTTGLKVDLQRLAELKSELEAECLRDKAFIYKEIEPIVKHKYPGTKPQNTFNISASKQLSWLLFIQLGNEFNTLTKEGKNLCKALDMKLPYSIKDKHEFIKFCLTNKGQPYGPAQINSKTKKPGNPKKIREPWQYMMADKNTLKKYAKKYKWVEVLLEYSKNMKLLSTYVAGLQERIKYGIIRPSFLQHGTTSGRYSSKNPNFQNLPRDDKRVKSCIVSRPGKVFVGADYSQLEPRVFASFSQDERLLRCFSTGEDFYSVIGTEIFNKYDVSLKKDDENSFATVYPDLRNISKAVALSATYGTTAYKMAIMLAIPQDEATEIIDNYFTEFHKVKTFMLASHDEAKASGQVLSYFGRPRRMPVAINFNHIYGNTPHHKLPYDARNVLNLAVNHKIQSTGASIINRASIAFINLIKEANIQGCSLVMQVHDELIVECNESDAKDVAALLQYAMEHTTYLPGVELKAEPKIAKNLADLK